MTKYLERNRSTDASVLSSYYLPEISIQDDVLRTESNDSGSEHDRSVPNLSLPSVISVDRVTQHAEFVEKGSIDEATIDVLFKRSIN